MKRYYKDGEGFNYDEDDDDDDLEEDDEDDDYIDVDTDDLVNAMKMDLVEMHLNQRVLDRAIEVAKSDWFWYFKSPVKKSRIISKIYKQLINLLNGEK